MVTLRIPTNLSRTLARRGEQGAAWLGALPALIKTLADEWSLSISEPFEPGGSTSWTAPVERSTDDVRLVLKVGFRDPEGLHEAQGLRAWRGEGAVRLHEEWRNETTSALLLERCEPGKQLWDMLDEEEQDMVVARLLERLWIEPPAGHSFRSLADMCDLWAAECEELLELYPPPDPGLVHEGLNVWRHLAATKPERSVLLVTDLHGGNILAAQREPWLVVDPQPYAGDPTYDPMQHMTNCKARLSADPVRLCERMASLTGVDSDRLRQWMFARLVVDSGWPFGNQAPTNYDVARRLAP